MEESILAEVTQVGFGSVAQTLMEFEVSIQGPEESIPPPVSTCYSFRQKKPSSKWNEDASFLAQPPHSSKKKGISPKGTPTYPLLISAKSDSQLEQYCLACRNDLDVIDNNKCSCFEFIRQLK